MKELEGLIKKRTWKVVCPKNILTDSIILDRSAVLAIKDKGKSNKVWKVRFVVQGHREGMKLSLAHNTFVAREQRTKYYHWTCCYFWFWPLLLRRHSSISAKFRKTNERGLPESTKTDELDTQSANLVIKTIIWTLRKLWLLRSNIQAAAWHWVRYEILYIWYLFIFKNIEQNLVGLCAT